MKFSSSSKEVAVDVLEENMVRNLRLWIEVDEKGVWEESRELKTTTLISVL